jgi:hypothetical protein
MQAVALRKWPSFGITIEEAANPRRSSMIIHFYMLCYRFEALVASHLDPESFGRYMAVGTQKNIKGNVLFFEITPDLKGNYFHLSDIEERCVPHPDGSPKRSKYISIYRVLEHLDMAEFGRLYLVTADGRILGLEPSDYDSTHEDQGPNLYQELSPISPMIVSVLPPAGLIKFITNPANPMKVPRLLFADLLVDRDDCGRLAGYLPYADPMHIRDCIRELETGSDKRTKTVSRNPRLHGFFRTIRRGFFLGDAEQLKFYRFPERRVLEIEHAKWWRSASESLF